MLGANTIIGLLNRGYTVRGMVRRPGSIPLQAPGLEEFTGNITSEEDVSNAVKGCDFIIHTAANTRQNSTRYEDYAAVNVEGTRLVLLAAGLYQVSRTVLVSSSNTVRYGSSDRPGNEDGDIRAPFTRSCYALSKREAERLALDAPRETIIVNPSFLLGAYDTRPSSGQLIIRGYRKKVIFVPPGGKNFIHVRDAAAAICEVLVSGRDKARYLLVNENMSYKAFYKLMNRVTRNKGWIITIPRGILLAVGLAGSMLSFFGIKTALHLNNMRILCTKNYYSHAKAAKELHLSPLPVRAAIEDAIAWFKKSGLLPP